MRTATLDIHTIGAGGGIARVGRRRRAAEGRPPERRAIPGPQPMAAAAQRDGNRREVVLGRLNPKTLLGGRMAIHPDAAEAR